MAGLRDIKTKIRSVRNIEQITQAMKLVATARLKQCVDRVLTARRYLAKVERILTDVIAALGGPPEHPFFQPREPKAVAIMIIAGERGLCGSFNHEVLSTARHYLDAIEVEQPRLILVGKKAIEGFRDRDLPVLAVFPNLLSANTTEALSAATAIATNAFLRREVDAVWVVYSRFVSPIEHDVVVRPLLPLQIEQRPGTTPRQFLHEPSAGEAYAALLPLHVDGVFSLAVLETAAAEQGSRMVAMGSATDKAQELLGDLTLTYNRRRQDSITRELAEVVAGAEALEI